MDNSFECTHLLASSKIYSINRFMEGVSLGGRSLFYNSGNTKGSCLIWKLGKVSIKKENVFD